MSPRRISELSPLEQVAQLAAQVVLSTPKKQSPFSRNAYVPWELIHRLNAALIAAGFEMAEARRLFDAEMKAWEREQKAKR